MFFWNKFCGLIILFLFSSVFSYAQYRTGLISTQSKVSLKNSFVPFRNAVPGNSKNSFLNFYQPSSSSFSTSEKAAAPGETLNPSASFIPKDFATCNYGFFCRGELKVEKSTRIPLRFRLGSLEQCNYYEGKH